MERRAGRAGRRWTALGLLGFGALATYLCVILLAGGLVDDAAIDGDLGNADAEVVSATTIRTLVRFQTPDGAEHVPNAGVLYPEALRVGQVVRVEYDRGNPDLVRVAGRGASLVLLPVGTLLVAVWAVVVGGVWWLRRRGPLSLRPAPRHE